MLGVSTILYLSLPWIVFAVGWLKLPWTIFILAITVYIASIFSLKRNAITSDRINLKTNLVLVFFSLLLSFMTGSGNNILLNTDWDKHNAIFYDLATLEWPIAYTFPNINEPVTLSYYLGWYLVPALVAKVSTIQIGLYAQLIWSAIGIYLTCLFLSKLAQNNRAVFVIMCFLTGISSTVTLFQNYIHSINISPLTTISSMYFVPNQFIPIVLITSVFLVYIESPKEKYLLLIFTMIFLSTFWSAVGLFGIAIPVFILVLHRYRRKINYLIWLLFPILPTIIYLVIAYLFYKPNVLQLHFGKDFIGMQNLITLSGITEYIYNYALNALIPLAIIYIHRKRFTKELINLFVFFGVFIAFLLTIRYGIFNDLAARGTIAFVFIQGVLFSKIIQSIRFMDLLNYKAGRFLVLITSCIVIFTMIANTFSLYKDINHNNKPMYKRITEYSDNEVLIIQYLGYTHSFFGRNIMKPITNVYKTKR